MDVFDEAPINKQSPLKESPLPQAGESARCRADDLLAEEVMSRVAALIAIWTVALFEWAHHLLRWPPMPWTLTIGALVASGAMVVQYRKLVPQIRQLLQGSQGEQAVGQGLEEVRQWDYRVIHDIKDEGYNIDHVLVGPGGVYVIETKTISKSGNAAVTYDGQHVWVDGQEMDRDPIAQVNRDRKDVPIWPVVLFPGWWVARQPRGVAVWVLNPKNLPGFLYNEPERLSPEDVALFAARIEDWVRRGRRGRAH